MELLVKRGQVLTWIMDGETGQKENVEFKLQLHFVKSDEVKGVYLDGEGTNVPDSIFLVGGEPKLPLGFPVWERDFSVEFGGLKYGLFSIKEIGYGGHDALLLFDPYIPLEFGGDGKVYETSQMFQEALFGDSLH